MFKVMRIDANGLFIEDVLLEDGQDVPVDCIADVVQEGLYLPKWNGTVWVEGIVIDPVVALQSAKDAKVLELNTACNTFILAGFSSSALGSSHQYKFDMEYQANMSQDGMMLSLDPTITAIPWPTIDAGIEVHTRDQFIQLCKDSKIFKDTNMYRYFAMKAQVLDPLTDTVVKVDAFGW